MKRFEGKTAFVTGAGSGIGLAAAQRIAAEGARVICAIESEAQRAATGKLESVVLDVSAEASWDEVVARTLAPAGGVDVLINNAGILRKGRAEDTPLELWHEVIATNLTGVFLGCKKLVPLMRARGGGAIVNTASLNAIRGVQAALAYAASKGGIVAMTLSLALDHARDNIRVNCICPGSVDTQMVRDIYAAAPYPEAARQAAIDKHPLRRMGTPADMAAAIAFLASADASFMTGQILAVDGGRTAV